MFILIQKGQRACRCGGLFGVFLFVFWRKSCLLETCCVLNLPPPVTSQLPVCLFCDAWGLNSPQCHCHKADFPFLVLTRKDLTAKPSQRFSFAMPWRNCCIWGSRKPCLVQCALETLHLETSSCESHSSSNVSRAVR